MVKKNACIFISGYGSNLKALIHNTRDHNFPINISLVVSNNSKAKGILHAKKKSICFEFRTPLGDDISAVTGRLGPLAAILDRLRLV